MPQLEKLVTPVPPHSTILFVTDAEHQIARPDDPMQFVEMIEAIARERPRAWLLVDSRSSLIAAS